MTHTHAVEGQRDLSRLPAIVQSGKQARNAGHGRRIAEGETGRGRPRFVVLIAHGQARDTTRDTTDSPPCGWCGALHSEPCAKWLRHLPCGRVAA